MESGMVTLISVAVNALAAIAAPMLARRMARQGEKLRQAEEAAETIAAGMEVIERAVEENKDKLSRTGAGDRIARAIRAYGPSAKELVDTARSATRQLRESAVRAYEEEIIARERAERAERLHASEAE